MGDPLILDTSYWSRHTVREWQTNLLDQWRRMSVMLGTLRQIIDHCVLFHSTGSAVEPNRAYDRKIVFEALLCDYVVSNYSVDN